MVSGKEMVYGKEKSGNLITNNFLRIKKGLKKKKKKAFEFLMPVVGVDAYTRDHECGGVGNTTNGVVVGGLKKKKKNIRHLIQNHPAQIGVTISSEQDDDDDAWSVVQERALTQALKELIPKGKDVILTNQRSWEQVATAVPGKKKTANHCKNKFALLVKKGFSFN